MRELPILMNNWSVRRILDGAKTQTRRIVPEEKHRPWKEIQCPECKGGVAIEWQAKMPGGEYCSNCDGLSAIWIPDITRAPYQVGDRLWCKETWVCPEDLSNFEKRSDACSYRADKMFDGMGPGDFAWKWKSARFMPKWAARIWLEVTSVRAERLQEIGEEDAKAEGIQQSERTGKYVPGSCDYATWAFRELWDSINGKHAPWDSNPWVFAYGFRVIRRLLC